MSSAGDVYFLSLFFIMIVLMAMLAILFSSTFKNENGRNFIPMMVVFFILFLLIFATPFFILIMHMMHAPLLVIDYKVNIFVLGEFIFLMFFLLQGKFEFVVLNLLFLLLFLFFHNLAG